MLELICTNDDNDFSIFNANGEGERCLVSNRVKIMTCTNKAFYSVIKRIVEKLIENEHIEFGMDAADCR